MFAISNMPVPLQIVTRIVPARYFVSALKDLFLKGNPLRYLFADTLFLVLFGLMVFIVANKRLKKKIV
jgi:ABC-2 type transport system permease protein